MQEIAEDVGFTAPALYAYFDSKEEILRELVRSLGRELEETFEPLPAAALPLREKLAQLLRRQLGWIDRRRDVFGAFFAMRMCGEQVMKPHERPEALGPLGYLGRLTRWVKRITAADGGAPGDADPAEMASVLMGITHGAVLRWIDGGRQGDLAAEIDRILDVFFHGFVGQRGGRMRRPTASPAAHARRRS